VYERVEHVETYVNHLQDISVTGSVYPSALGKLQNIVIEGTAHLLIAMLICE
jgi:hypothetical protein